jgi:hypothetical protein
MNRLTRVREAAMQLSREKQIGLAVLGGLSFILVAVIVWRLGAGGRGETTQPSAPETNVLAGQPAAHSAAETAKPTVVRQAGHETPAARLGGLTGQIAAAVPPSDPINSVDPPQSRGHGDDRTSVYVPRVAERTPASGDRAVSNEDLRANPLRDRSNDHLSGAPGVVASDSADPDAAPPRRPLRRPIEDDLDVPPPRRSVYNSAEKVAATASDHSSGAAAADESLEPPADNALRRRIAGGPAAQQNPARREPIADDEVAPLRTPSVAARSPAVQRQPAPATSVTERITTEQTQDERLTPVRSASAIANTPPAATRTYLVHEGDTIYDIAQFELGRSSRWVEIVALNRATLGEEIHFLKPGMKLQLPNDEADTPRVAQQPR